jgi:hypothetical protein
VPVLPAQLLGVHRAADHPLLHLCGREEVGRAAAAFHHKFAVDAVGVLCVHRGDDGGPAAARRDLLLGEDYCGHLWAGQGAWRSRATAPATDVSAELDSWLARHVMSTR